jgi:hypothetical protein
LDGKKDAVGMPKVNNLFIDVLPNNYNIEMETDLVKRPKVKFVVGLKRGRVYYIVNNFLPMIIMTAMASMGQVHPSSPFAHCCSMNSLAGLH